MSKPNIFTYHDYMKFLTDWLDYLKTAHAGFSLRKLAGEAGIAVGYLPMALSGKRPLTEKALIKLLPKLKLRSRERTFLLLLRTIGESENQAERVQALTKIQKFKMYRENNFGEVEVHRYLTKWFYVCIREMSMIEGFSADPHWIRSRLRGQLTILEIELALKFLVENGFMKEDNGQLKAVERNLNCRDGAFKLSLGKFHTDMLHFAQKSIAEVPRAQRSLLCHTAAIREQDFPEITKILEEALQKIERFCSGAVVPDAIYHIEFAAFPMTKVCNKALELQEVQV